MFNENTPFEKIYCISDINELQCVFIPGNRIIRNPRVNAICTAFRNGERIEPIQITPLWELIDGQHRITAWRKLTDAEREANPIRVIVNDEVKPALELAIKCNSKRKSWTMADYMNAYVIAEKPAYLLIQKLQEEFPQLTLCAAVQIVKGSRETEVFNNGGLNITQPEFSMALMRCEFLEKVEEVLGNIVWTRDIIKGMYNVFDTIDNEEEFLDNLDIDSIPLRGSCTAWTEFYKNCL